MFTVIKPHMLTFSLLTLLSFKVYATPNMPSDLLYQGKPIDPLCLYEMENHTTAIDLKKCGIQAVAKRKVTGTDKELIKNGFIGFDYLWGDESDFQSNAYSYYKVLGQYKDAYLIYTLNNSGGTGQFSDLFWLKRTAYAIELKHITGGDRCNGGINQAKREGTNFTFNVNLTPADFFDLVKTEQNRLKPYDDLAACAACCVAKANFQINPTIDPYQATLISVELDRDNVENNLNNNSHYQDCFDNLFNQYIKQGKEVMTPDALKVFVKTFNQQCVNVKD